MGSPVTLILASLFSLFGLAFFVYGKKESDFAFLAAGALLMVYPFFVSGAVLIALIGIVLTAAPFAARWLGYS